jgi:hypothetical protein
LKRDRSFGAFLFLASSAEGKRGEGVIHGEPIIWTRKEVERFNDDET